METSDNLPKHKFGRKSVTLQKMGDTTIEHDNLKPFYGMVVYQRMTNNELAETKKAYDYDANIDFTLSSKLHDKR